MTTESSVTISTTTQDEEISWTESSLAQSKGICGKLFFPPY